MRIRRVATAALAVGVVPLLAVPAYAETGYGQLIVTPTAVSPGQRVSLLGTCPDNGTVLRGLVSSAFVGGAATITQSSSEQFHGTAVISAYASGSYTVSAVCGSGSPSTRIEVAGSGAATSPAPTSSAPATTAPATTPVPVTTTAPVPHPTTPWRHYDASSGSHAGAPAGSSQRNPSSDPVKSTPTGTTSSPTGTVTVKAVEANLTAAATSSNTPLWLGAGALVVAAAGLGVLLTRRRIRRPTGR